MTANAQQADRERCLEAGMNDFLTKPIEPDQLWNTLLKWIKPGRAGFTRAAQPAPAEADALPAPIAGLDMAAALRRVLGNRPLYLKMLRKFAEEHAATPDKLRSALAAADNETAMRIAHTLRGLAGTIGSKTIVAPVADLEQAIRSGQTAEQIEPLIEALSKPFTALTNQLLAALPAAQEVTALADIDPVQREAVCRQLTELLRDDDPNAELLWDEQAPLLAAALPAHFKRIEASIRRFDFQQALLLLAEATL